MSKETDDALAFLFFSMGVMMWMVALSGDPDLFDLIREYLMSDMRECLGQ